MFYIGIDIGKRHHETGLINDKGDHVGKSIRFANSKVELLGLLHAS
ncbi:hypothetical protein [Virgibacillus dokdonensis]|nr:hypothetical protein [Virgibacillus dokdonensis]